MALTRAAIVVARFALLAVLTATWEGAVRRGWLDPFYFSQPSAIAGQIVEWVRDGAIFRHVWVTLAETGLGFLTGASLGVVVGLLLAFSPAIAAVFEPFVVLLNALPRIVLAPLFVLWFGLGMLSKVVMAASLVFFVVLFATVAGIKQIDRIVLDNARVLGARPHHLVRHVYVPAALGWIFSSLRASVGEYLGSSEGMGWLIYLEESMFRSTGVMAGLTVLLGVVAVIDASMVRLERRLAPWRQ
jgi:NitT/TauT family transport system permease protein